jgi:hypothetical protein
MVRWIVLALILGVVGSCADCQAFTDAYEMYIYNRTNDEYYVRIKNEDSSWTADGTLGAGECGRFTRIEQGKWSIRVYRGDMLTDFIDFRLREKDRCFRIRSETGKLEVCHTFYCF